MPLLSRGQPSLSCYTNCGCFLEFGLLALARLTLISGLHFWRATAAKALHFIRQGNCQQRMTGDETLQSNYWITRNQNNDIWTSYLNLKPIHI